MRLIIFYYGGSSSVPCMRFEIFNLLLVVTLHVFRLSLPEPQTILKNRNFIHEKMSIEKSSFGKNCLI